MHQPRTPTPFAVFAIWFDGRLHTVRHALADALRSTLFARLRSHLPEHRAVSAELLVPEFYPLHDLTVQVCLSAIIESGRLSNVRFVTFESLRNRYTEEVCAMPPCQQLREQYANTRELIDDLCTWLMQERDSVISLEVARTIGASVCDQIAAEMPEQKLYEARLNRATQAVVPRPTPAAAHAFVAEFGPTRAPAATRQRIQSAVAHILRENDDCMLP